MKISINAWHFIDRILRGKKGIKVSNLKSISRFIDVNKGCRQGMGAFLIYILICCFVSK